MKQNPIEWISSHMLKDARYMSPYQRDITTSGRAGLNHLLSILVVQRVRRYKCLYVGKYR